jgi:hypothetical protein
MLAEWDVGRIWGMPQEARAASMRSRAEQNKTKASAVVIQEPGEHVGIIIMPS